MPRLLSKSLCLLLACLLAVSPVAPASGSTFDAIRDADLDILRFPLKMYDIVPSDWSMRRKAEISALIDIVEATQEEARTPWYNVFGHIRGLKAMNDARKDFMVKTKSRVQLQNALEARPFHLDAGLHAHKLILKAADFAGGLDGTGPIYSELETRYNRMISILIERDKTSVFNVIKRFQLNNELRKESAEVYRLSKRLKDSKILSIATAFVKGSSSSGSGKKDTTSKILKYGAIAGGVIAVVGGIWKLLEGSKSSSPKRAARISDDPPAPARATAAPAAAAVETFAASPVDGDAAGRLRTLQNRYSLEAGKDAPDTGVLRELEREMEAVRGR